MSERAQLWLAGFALVAVYGVGEAFFGPAFGALVPQIVPAERLVAANALDSMVRPAAFRLAGPALGGIAVAALGAGAAFVVDAGTFAVSALCLAAIRARPRPAGDAPAGQTLREIREGLRFVRSQPWLARTLAVTAFTVLAFAAPQEVLLPIIVRNHVGGDAADLGLVLASGGLAAVVAALAFGQIGMPRRRLRTMALAWAASGFAVVGYGAAEAVWQAMVASALIGAGLTVGMVIWTTLMQTRVPNRLLGRVTSVDWMVSISLTPLSFAIAGPVAELLGARATLIGAGLVAGACNVVLLVLLAGED